MKKTMWFCYRPGLRAVGLFAIALLLGASNATGQTGSSNSAPQTDTFKTLVTKLKSGDKSIDFKALRLASVDSKEKEAGKPDTEAHRSVIAAYKEKKFQDAVKAGEVALKTSYLDLELHVLLATAYRELGDNKKFEFHRDVYLGLINSIVDGADGKSAATAYVVIDVSEEYAVLRALELNRGSQALRTEGGHKYDVLTVKDPKTNTTRDVWFNIDAVWRGYEKIFK